MEVFIPYDGTDEAIPFLDMALKGWEKVRFAEPKVIMVKPGPKFDMQFRVAADGIAKGDYYVLADVDAVPDETYVISAINKHLRARPQLGMALIRPVFDVGGRVRVVRKGVVEKWPPKESQQYDQEHAQAIVSKGYTFEIWEDVCYRPIPSVLVH